MKRGSAGAFIATGHGPWGISLGPGMTASKESFVIPNGPAGTGKVLCELILDGVANSAEVSHLEPSHYIKSSHL